MSTDDTEWLTVRRTVPIKLEIPDDRVDDLHRTIEQFQTAVNYSIEHGRTDDGYLMTTRAAIHDAVYDDLRDETDLVANHCIRAYSKALEMMKGAVADWQDGNSRPVPTFDQPTVVNDEHTLTMYDRSATLATVDGRVEVAFDIGEYQAEYLDDEDYEKRMGTLHYQSHEDRFYLHLVLQKEVRTRDTDRILGVDLNLKNAAVTSTGQFYDGGEILWKQNHYFRLRQRLQNKDTRSATQTLTRVSGRENRFVLDRLHTISRRIVEEAQAHDCSYIAVEDLEGIREQIGATDGRLQRQLHRWSFDKLQSFIEYKAAEYGIRLARVPPAYTSRTCSKCGHQAQSNRDSETGWFECTACGYELDGDYNAAKNIGLRLTTLPAGERPAGLGQGQLALKSGTLKVNDTDSVYSSLEFEPESNAQTR